MKDIKTSPFQALWGRTAQKVDPGHLAQMLLNLVNEPAVLYDAAQGRLLHANSPFLVLTAYSEGEVASLTIDGLFDKFDRTLLTKPEETQLNLKLRSRPPLPVVVRMNQVDANSQWYVFRITTLAERQHSSRPWQDLIIEKLKALPTTLREKGLDQTLSEIISIPSMLFDTNIVCIYYAQKDAPELRKVKSMEKISFFPEVLPASDLIRLTSPLLWIPGKRVATELHRAARIGGLSFTASVPLGEEKAAIGLLVIGGIDAQPPAILPQVMELLANYTTLAYDQTIRDENLSQELEKSVGQNLASDVMFEYIQDGILVLNPNLTIDSVNPAAELILGYTSGEIIGQRVENILISPDRLAAVLASATEGVSTPNLEGITLHHREGQTFHADVKILPYESDGRVSGILVIIRDISEHEQIRLQTRQLEQRALLGEFMGVFAHEVLNPINSISTGAQLLARRLGPDNPNLELVTRMENDCQRLHHQMEALKGYARPYEPFQEPVDMGSLLVRIIERWRPRMSRVNVSPVYQIPENLPKVLGDWRALEQVFTNLISNATDAMSQNGGMLSVKLEVMGGMDVRKSLEISVTDNGPGIPDEIRGRIFEPFVTTKSTGTGLGLAITRRIVTAHHGRIDVKSFPGGTVFTVILPTIEEKA